MNHVPTDTPPLFKVKLKNGKQVEIGTPYPLPSAVKYRIEQGQILDSGLDIVVPMSPRPSAAYLFWAVNADGTAYFFFDEPMYRNGQWEDKRLNPSHCPPVIDDMFWIDPVDMEALGVKAADTILDLKAYYKVPAPAKTAHYSNGQYNSSYGANQWAYPKCTHDGTSESFSITTTDGRKIYIHGADATGADYARPCVDVHLDCADAWRTEKKSPLLIRKPPSAAIDLSDLMNYVYRTPVTVSIDWPDMRTPPLQAKFWTQLLATLPNECRLLISCVGSHGRTGTAMAALLLAINHGDVVKCVEFVRKYHCDKAVESDSQLKYLTALHAKLRETGENSHPLVDLEAVAASKKATGMTASPPNQPGSNTSQTGKVR